jgi:hypothetical protein
LLWQTDSESLKILLADASSGARQSFQIGAHTIGYTDA